MSCYWNIQTQPLLLGSLLVIRKELELLARLREGAPMELRFSTSEEDVLKKAPYLPEILKSKVPCKAIFHAGEDESSWPSLLFGLRDHPFDSMKRISLLYDVLGKFPALEWDEPSLEKADSLSKSWSLHSPRIVAVHLKRQQGGAEESNANIEAWKQLFREECSTFFVLLGKDPLESSLAALPNVLYTQTLGLGLAEELAFISIADAFLGMSSGIAAAAILSKTPYVIFKHPNHHKEAMEQELSRENRFSFALPKQEMWRVEDHLDNLRKANEILCSANTH